MNRKTLSQIYKEHTGKVTDRWSLYLEEYECLFSSMINKRLRILEIGVQNGGSLEIWSKYFKNASILIGCDINPKCAFLDYDDPRISIIVGDANSDEVNNRLFKICSKFDIIIDDGSHLSSDIINTFVRYFPYLAKDGLYIIEDLHCSYWKEYEGGLYDPFSSMSFFKRLADVINHEHWGVDKTRADILSGILKKCGNKVDEEELSRIHSIGFFNSLCVIRKKNNDVNGLGRRVVGGMTEIVAPGHLELNGLAYHIEPKLMQKNNPWATRMDPPDEKIIQTEERLKEKEEKLNQLKDDLIEKREKLIQSEERLIRSEERLMRLEEKLIILEEKLNQSANKYLKTEGKLIQTEDKLLKTEEKLKQTEEILLQTEEKLADYDKQLVAIISVNDDLRNSTSWRITAPLRLVSKRIKKIMGWRFVRNDKSLKSQDGQTMPHQSYKKRLRIWIVQRGHIFYRRHMKGTRLGWLIGQKFLQYGIVSEIELQNYNRSSTSIVLHDNVHQNKMDDFQIESDYGIGGFHLSPPLTLEVSAELTVKPRINVLLPSLRLKHMSGGPNTALLLAALLAEKGEKIRLISCDAPLDGEPEAIFPHMGKLIQRKVLQKHIEIVDCFNRSQTTLIGANDLFLATAWWTAQIAKYAVENTVYKEFIYLIQDIETILHEGSTFQARASETYNLPHIPVINTRLLRDHLVKEGIGQYANPEFVEKALWFEPALDRNYYFPDPMIPKNPGKKVMLFYARPSVARRNLFEIGLVAIRHAVASGVIDNENWEVWAMGEKIKPVDLGNGVILNPMPWLPFNEYARRIRTADLLISLMLSPHPSYPPLEMAASGKIAITNSFSVKTADRMRSLSPNIIVAEPTVKSIATALENAAGRINAGLPSYDSSGDIALPFNWDESLKNIIPVLMQKIRKLRETPMELGRKLSLFKMDDDTSEYERFRRTCLARRRDEGEYQQEKGLLSFITTAYNTDPVFLEELGSRILLQDGGINFEWLLLDNGSNNKDTVKVLNELSQHPCVRLLRVNQNLGIIGGMRYLLENASGRYILPLDSDDLIELDCVNLLTQYIKENDYPPLLYTDEDKINGKRYSAAYMKPDWDPVLFLHSCYIAHLCAIDRELGLKLGIYTDKKAEGCHDWDSFIRFMKAGYVPIHVPEVLYSWRIHMKSTSGNIMSKSYISESHRHTLQNYLDYCGIRNLELRNSPLFGYNVDWWFRRKHVEPIPMQTIVIGEKVNSIFNSKECSDFPKPLLFDPQNGLEGMKNVLYEIDSELICLLLQDIIPDDDNWCWDAMALLELFDDAVMVGGIIHNGKAIIDGPRVFGFGDGFDCPDKNRLLSDPGYGAKMHKPHTVSAVSSAFCVVKRQYLMKCLIELIEESVSIEMLGIWLGALAIKMEKRIVYSPFMRARISNCYDYKASMDDREYFLSRFWEYIPDKRLYSQNLGNQEKNSYLEVEKEENRLHRLRLQSGLLSYENWLKMKLKQRANMYPVNDESYSITLITTVYEETDIKFLEELAESVKCQTVKAIQWIIIAHGPIATKKINYIKRCGAKQWGATVIVEKKSLGIMGAMKLGLDNAIGEYIIPVDADDILTSDAIQIMTNAITRFETPDLLFSDEDILVGEKPASPYLRSAFDPILNLDSSYIWHLCAINRERAIELELYTDQDATWCHDWDTVMRVANVGGSIEHIPEVLYHWRQHTGSTTNNFKINSRSIKSIKHILKRHISSLKKPENFFVTEWPENRGTKEFYIARRTNDLPKFVWFGDPEVLENNKCDEESIIVYAEKGILIESQKVFVEVARIFELHPSVGAIGGICENNKGVIVDGCYMANSSGLLESPWIGNNTSNGGPYSLALKPQTVLTTGNSLAFFRISALMKEDLWPLGNDAIGPNTIMKICCLLQIKKWTVAFSPLIRAHVNSVFRKKTSPLKPPVGIPITNHALVRYGSDRNFRVLL